MADCEFRMRVQAYHDGELSPEERQNVELHLKACPACARELDQLQRISAIFSTASLPGISPRALRRLHRGRVLVLEPALVRTSEFFAAAAAAILLVSAAWLWRASSTEEMVAMPSWQDPVTYQVDASTDNDPVTHVAQIILADLQ